jgi:hypothetical protein
MKVIYIALTPYPATGVLVDFPNPIKSSHRFAMDMNFSKKGICKEEES